MSFSAMNIDALREIMPSINDQSGFVVGRFRFVRFSSNPYRPTRLLHLATASTKNTAYLYPLGALSYSKSSRDGVYRRNGTAREISHQLGRQQSSPRVVLPFASALLIRDGLDSTRCQQSRSEDLISSLNRLSGCLVRKT
jgi:hypothetical protein